MRSKYPRAWHILSIDKDVWFCPHCKLALGAMWDDYFMGLEVKCRFCNKYSIVDEQVDEVHDV